MALSRCQILCVALLVAVVTSSVTSADDSAHHHSGTGENAANSKQTNSAAQSSKATQNDKSGSSTQPRPGTASAQNLGEAFSDVGFFDYDLQGVFGDINSDVEPKTASSHRSSPGSAPVDVAANDGGESIARDSFRVDQLPNGEQFRTPPPLVGDSSLDTPTRHNVHIVVHEQAPQIEPVQPVQLGDAIPKGVNSFTGSTQNVGTLGSGNSFGSSYGVNYQSGVPASGIGAPKPQGYLIGTPRPQGYLIGTPKPQGYVIGTPKPQGYVIGAPRPQVFENSAPQPVYVNSAPQQPDFPYANQGDVYSYSDVTFLQPEPSAVAQSYVEVPADSYVSEPLADRGLETNEEPFNGFISTWWNTGSFSEAASGFTSNIWTRLTKGIGTKVAKKSKKILVKAAPVVKKVVGAGAVAGFL